MKTTDIRNIKKALILRPEGSLGDAVLSSAIIREIKKYYPAAQIDAAAFGAAYLFLQDNKYITNLYKLPVRTVLRKHQRIPSLLLCALKLRRNNYGVVVDSSTINYPAWNFFLKILYKNAVLVTPFKQAVPNMHRGAAEAETLARLGIQNPDLSYDLPSAPPAETEKYLKENNIKNFILFNIFASNEDRTVSPENSVKIIQFLRRKNAVVVIPFLPANSGYTENLKKEITDGYVFFRQTPSIADLTGLIQKADAVITTETAVVHIAAGYKKPTLAFYGHNQKYYLPDNASARVLFTPVRNGFDMAGFEKLASQMLQS